MHHKTFTYSVPELSLYKEYVYVDISLCPTLDDLKKKITDDLNIPNECLKFQHPPKKELKDIDKYTDFWLVICDSCYDISILMPNGKKIVIEDGYKLKFEDIFPFIEKEGIYFSDNCIKNNINIFSSNKEIKNHKYPFLSNQPSFELKLISNPTVFNYRGITFILSHYEFFDEVEKLFKKAFPLFNVTIKTPNKFYSFNPSELEENQIDVNKLVIFYNYDDENLKKIIHIGICQTVSDIKIKLAEELKKNIDSIQPKNLIIYNDEKHQIENSNKPFISFVNLNKSFCSSFYKVSGIKKKATIKDKKETKIPNFRTYNYSFVDFPICFNKIAININEYQTIDDLKSQIAFSLNISNDRLKFDNVKTKELIYYDNYFDFELSISIYHSDLDIWFPNGEKIKIKNCYKMEFEDIIQYLEKEGYYYSQTCIYTNFHLYLSGKEIRHEKYPFLSINEKSKLEIKYTGNIVELKYNRFHFTFSENEESKDAITLIQKIFPTRKVIIQDSHCGKEFQLKSREQYNIRIEMTVKFKDFTKSNEDIYIDIDISDTVSEVQKQLSEKINISGSKIKSNDLIIYNYLKEPISELNKSLLDFVKTSKKLYYKIDQKSPTNSPSKQNKETSNTYKFEFNGEKKEIIMINNSTIESQLPTIKKEFEISSEKLIKLQFITDDNSESILDLKQKMSTFQNGILLKNFPNKTKQKKDSITKINLVSNESSLPESPQLIEKEDKKEKKGRSSSISECKLPENKVADKKKRSSSISKYIPKLSPLKTPPESTIPQSPIEKKSPKSCSSKSDSTNVKLKIAKFKYSIKIKDDDDDEIIELEKDATVETMKEKIAKDRNVKNAMSIKIILQGKELKNKTLLENLDIKNRVLSVILPTKNDSSSPKKSQKMTIYKEDIVSINQESENDRLKKIIEEQNAKIIELEQTIKELNINNKEHYIKKPEEINNDDSLSILDFNQINNLEKIKNLKKNQNESIYEVCQTQTNTIKQKFIQKTLKKTSYENFRDLIKEHEMLKIQNHINILKTCGIFLSDEKNPPSIIFEHLTCDLENKIKNEKLSNKEIIIILYEIAEGMRYVHFRNIIHRNLNPKSIFISDDGNIKIGEFGISKIITLKEQLTLSMSGIIGSLEFISPELINDEKYNEKVDVFSYGRIVLLIMNGGKFELNKEDSSNQIEIPKTFTEFSSKFIEECTKKNPEERPSFKAICKNIEDNYHQMIALTEEEKQKIKSFIEEHKKKIPNYS